MPLEEQMPELPSPLHQAQVGPSPEPARDLTQTPAARARSQGSEPPGRLCPAAQPRPSAKNALPHHHPLPHPPPSPAPRVTPAAADRPPPSPKPPHSHQQSKHSALHTQCRVWRPQQPDNTPTPTRAPRGSLPPALSVCFSPTSASSQHSEACVGGRNGRVLGEGKGRGGAG